MLFVSQSGLHNYYLNSLLTLYDAGTGNSRDVAFLSGLEIRGFILRFITIMITVLLVFAYSSCQNERNIQQDTNHQQDTSLDTIKFHIYAPSEIPVVSIHTVLNTRLRYGDDHPYSDEDPYGFYFIAKPAPKHDMVVYLEVTVQTPSSEWNQDNLFIVVPKVSKVNVPWIKDVSHSGVYLPNINKDWKDGWGYTYSVLPPPTRLKFPLEVGLSGSKPDLQIHSDYKFVPYRVSTEPLLDGATILPKWKEIYWEK